MRDLTRLELVTEAVRAALEELARTAGHALEGLVDDDWGRRYGRPVRLGKNPTRPKTRMNEAGADARRLLEHLAARCPDLLRGPRVEALRQILVQNYHWDPAGRLRWRDDEGDAGLPPSAARIVSPYDLAACYSRRGQVTRWTGYLAHRVARGNLTPGLPQNPGVTVSRHTALPISSPECARDQWDQCGNGSGCSA